MRYALLIYANEQDWASQTEEESQTQFQEYMSFTKDIVHRGLHKGARPCSRSPPPPRSGCATARR